MQRPPNPVCIHQVKLDPSPNETSHFLHWNHHLPGTLSLPLIPIISACLWSPWTALQFVCKAGLNSNWQHRKLPTQNGHAYLCSFISCLKFSFSTSSLKRPCTWYRVIHLQDKCLLISCYPIYNSHVIQSELSGLRREFSVRPRKAPSINSSVQAESRCCSFTAEAPASSTGTMWDQQNHGQKKKKENPNLSIIPTCREVWTFVTMFWQ